MTDEIFRNLPALPVLADGTPPEHIQNDVSSSGELFMRSQEGYFDVYSNIKINLNEHQNNTRVSAVTVHHESTYIILFLSRHCDS